MTRSDDRALAAALQHSVAGRTASWFGHSFATAWRHSGLRRSLTSHRLRHVDLVRMAGAALVAASLTHATLIRLLPSATVGTLPIATSLIVSGIGLSLGVAPSAVVSAWRSSVLRHLMSRGTHHAR